jgi:ABC-2 type transport system permease protein
VTTPAVTPAGPVRRSVLVARGRPPRPNPLAALLTFAWRAVLGIKHAPEQLGDAIVMPFMLVLMFTYLFGGAIAGSAGGYLHYVLPGILVMTVMLLTVNTGALLNRELALGIFDRFRTLPFWQPATIVGALAADSARYTFAVAMTVGLGLALGFRPEGGALGVLFAWLLLLLFGFGVSWIFTTLAMVVRKPESISQQSMILLFPLAFISDIFIRPETMPGWIQVIVRINPVSHVATAVRGLLYGTLTAGELGLTLLIIAVIVAIFAPLTMVLYRRKY